MKQNHHPTQRLHPEKNLKGPGNVCYLGLTPSHTDGRLATVTGGGNVAVPQAFTYGYTPNSDLIATVTGPVHTVTNTWEPNRDVLDIKENKVGTNLVSKYDYSVNEIGQRTQVVSSLGAFSTSYSLSNLWRWKYDSKGQIKSEITNGLGGETRIYNYDDIGNRQNETTEINRPTVGPYSSSKTYNVNSVNQYLDVGGLTWIHDDDGNVSSQQMPLWVGFGPPSITTQILQWDGENRLNSSTKDNIQAAYLYDTFSRRIAKISSNSQTTTAYIYDGWNCVAEYSKNSSSSSAVSIASTYLWGRDLSENLQGAGGVGGLLSTFMKSAGSSVANLYFPAYDGNGNIREYLGQSGSVVVHYDYDPYGEPTAQTGIFTASFTYGFSTKPRDAETGLYYYGYRYYDPLTGRWPSRDPIQERGGVNLYGYVGNDGINWIDIFGLLGKDEKCIVEIQIDHGMHWDAFDMNMYKNDLRQWASEGKKYDNVKHPLPTTAKPMHACSRVGVMGCGIGTDEFNQYLAESGKGIPGMPKTNGTSVGPEEYPPGVEVNNNGDFPNGKKGWKDMMDAAINAAVKEAGNVCNTGNCCTEVTVRVKPSTYAREMNKDAGFESYNDKEIKVPCNSKK